MLTVVQLDVGYTVYQPSS